MVNVNLIEGHDGRDAAYDAMKNHLFNGELFTNKDICEAYGLGGVAIANLKKELCNDLKISFPKSLTVSYARYMGGLSGKRKAAKSKYYSKHPYDGKFEVAKHIHGKCRYCGRYETEEEAKAIVEEMKKVGWDMSQLDKIKSKILEND